METEAEAIPNKLNIVETVPRWLGRIVTFVGMLAIFGWFIEYRAFLSLEIQWETMKFNTALLFVLSGLSLQFGIHRKQWYLLIGIFITVFAALTLLQYVLPLSFGIDELFITDHFTREAAKAFPGRMSPATAINFVIFGLGLIFLRYSHIYTLIAVLAISLMSLLAMTGYLYDVTDFYAVFIFSTMALNTALSFFLLSIGLLFSARDNKIVTLITSDHSGGYMIRRLMPGTLLIFILTGFIWNWGSEEGFYGSSFSAALTLISNIVIVSFIILWTAHGLERVEADLRDSEKRFRTMLETGTQGVLLVDAEGYIIHHNGYSETLFQMSRNELLGCKVETLVPQSYRQGHQQLRKDYMETLDTRPMGKNRELEALRGDGTVFPVEVSLSPIEIDDESYVVAFVADISERKALIEERRRIDELQFELLKERELQALKSRFITTVSHEFRTPLAIIGSSIGIISRYFEKLSRDEIESKLDKANDQIHYMKQMLTEVLDVNKIESGVIPFQPERINVSELIRDIVENVKIADANKHTIQITCDEGLLVADPNLLNRILSNLLSNALKYSSEGTTVFIKAKQDHNRWYFTVQDTGIGIPDADLDKLFEPFHRARNVEHYAGTGLGLSIVKNYVDQHQGQIKVATVEGEGTTIEVIIPNTDKSMMVEDLPAEREK